MDNNVLNFITSSGREQHQGKGSIVDVTSSESRRLGLVCQTSSCPKYFHYYSTLWAVTIILAWFNENPERPFNYPTRNSPSSLRLPICKQMRSIYPPPLDEKWQRENFLVSQSWQGPIHSTSDSSTLQAGLRRSLAHSLHRTYSTSTIPSAWSIIFDR
jgi:hypothetical protein